MRQLYAWEVLGFKNPKRVEITLYGGDAERHEHDMGTALAMGRFDTNWEADRWAKEVIAEWERIG